MEKKNQKTVIRSIHYFISPELQNNSELQEMRFHSLFTNEKNMLIAYNETSFTVQTLTLLTVPHFCKEKN